MPALSPMERQANGEAGTPKQGVAMKTVDTVHDSNSSTVYSILYNSEYSQSTAAGARVSAISP